MQVPKWVVVGDRVTAVEAAKMFGLHVRALTDAIDAGHVPSAERIVTGTRCIRLVDPVGLDAQLEGLPRCAYVSKAGVACSKPVSLKPGSIACTGPHQRAIETKGKSWRSPEAIEKSNAAKRGKARPDVVERWTRTYADPETRYRQGLSVVKGRKLSRERQLQWERRLSGTLGARAAGRVAGKQALETRDPETAARVVELRRNGASIRTIARVTGLSKRQVEGIIERANKVSP
jgi:hypothetical protein